MDELVALLLLHWRVGAGILTAACMALLLCIAFAWFVGFPSILLVLIGGGAGLLWEGEVNVPSAQEAVKLNGCGQLRPFNGAAQSCPKRTPSACG